MPKGRSHDERQNARALGQKHYSTGKPCERGHTAPRFTSTGHCTDCERERMKLWARADRAARGVPSRAERIEENDRRRAGGPQLPSP